MIHFICPLCRELLSENSQGLSCLRHHQFDRAREGYFNLLPAHHKNSRQPGDAKMQLQARHKFLKAGFFAPLIHALNAIIPPTTQRLLDIGCGEGYFTNQVAGKLSDSAQVYGIDIAKEGVRVAAKGSRVRYAVASSFALPILDHSMEVITRIYAPSKDSELQRVLAPEGCLVIVTPGENHLLGLRRSIYQDVRPHPEPQPPEGFVVSDHRRVQSDLLVPAGELAAALLHMTPFAWRLSKDKFADLTAQGLSDHIDFNVAVYRRN